MHNKKVLSLFSGCGGMDLGFEGNFQVVREAINPNINHHWIGKEIDDRWIKLKCTGYSTIFANDISKYAEIAWVHHFTKRGISPDVFHQDSIVDLVNEEKRGKTIFPKPIDIVTGGFPCQDFSVSGKRKGFNSHKSHTGEVITTIDEPNIANRGQLYIWMKEVIEITKPKLFIAENVKGLVNLANVKDIIANDFRNINNDGYLVVSPQVLNAGEYGIPQNRERVFFIGFLKSALTRSSLLALSKNEIPLELSPYPEPTHYLIEKNGPTQANLFQSQSDHRIKFVPSRKVLEDLPEPDNPKADISQKSYSKAKYYGEHVQGQTEVDLDGLAPTIRAEHHGNIEYRRLSEAHGGKHLDELKNGLSERRLTVRECARIQTFPDDFEFVIPPEKNIFNQNLSASQAYRLIGNAVPPFLAYHVAKKIESLWETYFGKE